MEVYTTILVIIIIFLLWRLSRRNFDYWKNRNVPFETPIPFLGNLPSLIGMQSSIGEYLAALCQKRKQPYFGLFIFSKPVLVIRDPQLVKAIMVKDFDHFQDRTTSTPDDPILSQMMFFAQSPQWRSVRNKLTPVFTTGKLKLMFNLINDQAQDMINYIEQTCSSDIDVKKISANFAVDAIAKCAFAIDAKCFQNENSEMMYIGTNIFSSSFRQFASWCAPGIVQFFKVGFFDPDCMQRLKRIFTEMMQLREGNDVKGHDMVEILLEARNNAEDKSQFSDDVILAQASQIFAAGFETSSATIAFNLYELCKQPDIQQKLRREIKDNIEKNNGITYEGMKEMKYLDMVVNETLRMYPVLAFLDRICNKDYKLPGTDVVVEKGTAIWIPIWAFHRNPEHFPEPDKYNPERFVDKSVYNSESLQFLPFGCGPRICIGYRFAMMLVKLCLIIILSRFQVERAKNTPEVMTISRIHIMLRRRKTFSLKLTPAID